MLSLTGYHIIEAITAEPSQTLAGSDADRHRRTRPKNQVYRAYRQSDRQPVIIKTPSRECPQLTEIARLRHEYDVAASLQSPYLMAALDLKQSPTAAIYEDIGGTSLDRLFTRESGPPDCPAALLKYLEIAIQLAKALRDLHQAKIVHKDIKPSNIVHNPNTGQVQLIDFGIASRLSQETHTTTSNRPFNSLEGTLAYLSPEQTGRMNRRVDYKSDFYSLGVTFYELLTGRVPFLSHDALELVHCHIAKVPTPPQLLNPDLPLPLSDVVMKLLSKSAEDRYQSAFGLLKDLEICKEQLERQQTISAFPLAQFDRTTELQIPAKLYGRETDVARLMQAAERVMSGGGTELLLVSGYSGVGKSVLVQEIHRPVAQYRGYFASGKFEQLKRNLPYFGFRQAILGILEQLLAESQPRLKAVKQDLQDALGAASSSPLSSPSKSKVGGSKGGHSGSNGPRVFQGIAQRHQTVSPLVGPINYQTLALHLIPELKALLDSPNSSPSDDLLWQGEVPARIQHELFCRLFDAIAQPEHPLVLFLDDLQWADTASIQLLADLLLRSGHERAQPLLLVGAYRENEVTANHPLLLTLEELQREGIRPEHLRLKGLDFNSVQRLIADSLALPESEVTPLADLMVRKTHGNPFFLTQLLLSLARDELLYFDGSQGRWCWDSDRLASVEICDNVIDLTVRKLQTLPQETQNLLMLAACIGNRFDLTVLSVVNERSPRRTAADLWEAIAQGMILPLNESYKIPLTLDASGVNEAEDAEIAKLLTPYQFLHDRVQQAALALISPEIRQDVRVQIGRLLLASTPPEALEEHIFEIVNQFNAGAALMVHPQERQQLAQLNLMAARKAKAASAWETASDYLDVGRIALGDEGWQRNYELTLAVYLEALEVEVALVNLSQQALEYVPRYRSEVLLATVLREARGDWEKARAYFQQLRFYGLLQRGDRAQLMAEQGLAALGIELAATEGSRLPQLPLPLADEAPEAASPQRLLAFEMLNTLAEMAALMDVSLLQRAIATQVSLLPQLPLSGQWALTCTWFASLEAAQGHWRQAQEAAEWVQTALEQPAVMAESEIMTTVHILLAARVQPWFQPLSETLPELRQELVMAREQGWFSALAQGALSYCSQVFWGEPTLAATRQGQEMAIASLQGTYPRLGLAMAQIWQPFLRRLMADGEQSPGEDLHRGGERGGETFFTPTSDDQSLMRYWQTFVTLLSELLFGEWDEPVATARTLGRQSPISLGLVDGGYQLAYQLLARLRVPLSSEELQEVEAQRNRLAALAQRVPENFQALCLLVQAELCQQQGEVLTAMEYYDRAIATAKDYGRWFDAALAHEQAATFYRLAGRGTIAHVYLQGAERHYQIWGALAKVRRFLSPQPLTPSLDQTWSDPLNATLGSAPLETMLETSVQLSTGDMLDRVTAIKATHALSSEIVLESLLRKLIEIVLENAGAQTGFLILAGPQELETTPGDVPPLFVEAAGTVTTEQITVRQGLALEQCQHLPHSLIYYVARRREAVALDDAASQLMGRLGTTERFANDPYIQQYRPRSLLCAPIERQGKLVGVLYLENNLTVGAFTRERLDLLRLLCSQAAISIENATLYESLQASERRERERAEQLERSLAELDLANRQLVQSEKMSALGQLVAGIAHEINNPVGFIVGNLTLADNYIRDLIAHLQLYRDRLPEPDEEIIDHAEDVDLDYLLEDAPKLMASMQVGVDRIREISKALRTFSRSDRDQPVRYDLHDGLESTLLILKHRLKANAKRPEIQIVRQYGSLPEVQAFAGQLNQVFTNLIANAIDALEETSQGMSYQLLQEQPNVITVTTELSEDEAWAVVRVADNGRGMSETVRSRIFERSFTTKQVGQGTGLGLSICRQIVVDKHGGSIECQSTLGQGTEFILKIPIRR
ncbi:trifunctional serine/threonine-protein kinase/ATP-binding protein/sensor histidine kinase [Sodalinema gerasimenkoae]|uniref:trifunctional serine/threonine-protein kinase/ATP-binding protein/sensor histidine kinase n=1 Tax=Sodalinema gerasimenkoae TaxID=2862348 RepID=UPI001356E44F|nr:AAA family ATPase [Sodalinema gerasimenkoae]